MPLAQQLLEHAPPSLLRWIGRQQFRPVIGPLVSRVSSRLREQPFTISHGHAKGLRLNPSGANVGYGLGTTEPLIQELLAEYVGSGDIVWDVGANVGFFTVLCARLVGESGRVVAVDPVPENVAALRVNVALNGFGNVAVLEAAVSDHSGTDYLQLFSESTWAKLDTPEITFEEGRSIRSIKVALTTLDALLGPYPAPTLVKIDVEGAEPAVLRGAKRLLAEVRPVVVCECHGTNTPVADALEEAGYVLRTVESEQPLREARWDVHVLATPR